MPIQRQDVGVQEMLNYFIRNEAKPSRLRRAASANPPEGIFTCGAAHFDAGREYFCWC